MSPNPRVVRARGESAVQSRLRAVIQVTLSAAFVLTATSPLYAAAPSAAERETARRLMEEGDDLAEKGELHNAMNRYRSAHAIMQVPTTGVNLAKVQAKLGLLVEARATAIDVANLPVTPSEPPVFAQARKSAIALADELEPRVPSLTTTVSPASASYTLTVDNVTLPAAARNEPYRMNPGAHTIRVDAPGYLSETLQVELAEGHAHSAPVQLKLVNADSAAVGGQPDGPLADGDPAAAGRKRGIIAVSGGGAVFAFGMISGIVAASKYGSLEDACPSHMCTPEHADRLSSANTFANLANVTIPLGLLGIGYGLYELLTLPTGAPVHANSSRLQLAVSYNSIVVGGSL